MKRAVLIAFFLAACGDVGTTPDGGPDGPAGSGSNAALAGLDPSPPDVALEWIVVALSTVVVAGSLRSRRRDAKQPPL